MAEIAKETKHNYACILCLTISGPVYTAPFSVHYYVHYGQDFPRMTTVRAYAHFTVNDVA